MGKTLVLTRKPNALFHYKTWKGVMHGRLGTLIVLEGDDVKEACVAAENGLMAGAISVPTGVLDITMKAGGGVKEIGRYTTIERMDGYIQLHPEPKKPYGITYEAANSAVAKLRKPGRCFRVHGGKNDKERGILIHEAPNVSWLIGCIGPRIWNDRSPHTETSKDAMDELFELVGKRAEMFVLDW